MKRVIFHSQWYAVPSQKKIMEPAQSVLLNTPPLKSKSNKPLAMNTEELLNILTYYHLQDFSSGRELIQALQEDDYARHLIAPANGIKRSTFFDTVNERGVEQLLYVFTELQKKASGILPTQHAELGNLIAIDGSWIDSVLSMHWAEYQSTSKKAKLHLGFNLNHAIPKKLFLTGGNDPERPFVSQIIDNGETAVLDRGYQAHRLFDKWQTENCHFICRIAGNTQKEILEAYVLPDKSTTVFYDAKVLLGTPRVNQTKEPLRLVGYNVDGKEFWIATDRFDLTAEQVAAAYKLRWEIENFFAWWKRHLKVYHLFARSKNGLMVQVLSGLITYILLAIYCHEEHGESVSIRRVRELRNTIRNEAMRLLGCNLPKEKKNPRKKKKRPKKNKSPYAKS